MSSLLKKYIKRGTPQGGMVGVVVGMFVVVEVQKEIVGMFVVVEVQMEIEIMFVVDLVGVLC